MRLVDAEDLMRCITKEYNRRGTGEGLRLAWIEKAVNDAPTVEPIKVGDVCKECWREGGNAVEVVRCKDCKNSDWYKSLDGKCLCYCMVHGKGGYTENDFCSRGEREEANEQTERQ